MKTKTTLARILIFGVILSGSVSLKGQNDTQNKSPYLNGEFWREQGLTRIIPFWQSHVRDTINGAFYMSLSQEGDPIPPWDKYPAMISRQVFGFTAAYLLSGDEQYLETARQGADYLLKYAWDPKYGGWFNRLDLHGNPLDTTKNVAYQLYTNVGLALYNFATGDESVLKRVRESIGIQKKYAYDPKNGGYFVALFRNLSVSDSSKAKHSHFGYSSSLLINMMMITRDEEIRRFAEELTQISIEKMTDPAFGWFYGYPGRFTSDWKLEPTVVNGKEVISAGAQLTACLSLLRLYEITGREMYRKRGVDLAERLYAAWDSTHGGWYDLIEVNPPHTPQDTSSVSWWIQSYGLFLQLHLYHITGEKRYLDLYSKMASFWNRNFIDPKYGGVFQTVSQMGVPLSTNKAVVWKASYHEMENALLNYLYLNLYVNQQPVKLFFHLRDITPRSKHFVSIVEDPSIQIIAVKINGKPWSAFDAAERSITLPGGKDLKIEVTLGTNSVLPETIIKKHPR